jgi:nucleotide-binding universal stress UspA family protein
MILICYDGSDDSKAAVQMAATLMPGQPATVLTIWEPFVEMISRLGPGLGLWPDSIDHRLLDEAAADAARDRARDGANRARRAGLAARPVACARTLTMSETIIAQAESVGARTIVLGTRGLAGVKSMMLGSVSQAVLQHADRPVLVVPSETVAAQRAPAPITRGKLPVANH